MLNSLLSELTTRFGSGSRWMLRQSYVNICNQLVTDRSLPLEEFACQLLTPLLDLKRDRVPNVRLGLARVINFQLKYEGKATALRPYGRVSSSSVDQSHSQVASLHINNGFSPLSILCADFFAGSNSPYRETLNETLDQLSADQDRDVSYYASVNIRQTQHCSQSSSLQSMDESTA